MMRGFIDYFSHNKYRLTMFALLAGATVFSVLIWRVRLEISGSGNYFFLIWNLFLAWIPFIIFYFTYTAKMTRKQSFMVISIAAFLSLIFFSNQPYILTDFQHHFGTMHVTPVW